MYGVKIQVSLIKRVRTRLYSIMFDFNNGVKRYGTAIDFQSLSLLSLFEWQKSLTGFKSILNWTMCTILNVFFNVALYLMCTREFSSSVAIYAQLSSTASNFELLRMTFCFVSLLQSFTYQVLDTKSNGLWRTNENHNFSQGCGVGGKISESNCYRSKTSDSDLSKISDSQLRLLKHQGNDVWLLTIL